MWLAYWTVRYQIGKWINGIKPITIEEIVVFLLFNKSFFLSKVIGNKNFFFSKIVGNKSLFFPKVIGNFHLWLESFRDTRLEYDNVTICSKWHLFIYYFKFTLYFLNRRDNYFFPSIGYHVTSITRSVLNCVCSLNSNLKTLGESMTFKSTLNACWLGNMWYSCWDLKTSFTEINLFVLEQELYIRQNLTTYGPRVVRIIDLVTFYGKNNSHILFQ